MKNFLNKIKYNSTRTSAELYRHLEFYETKDWMEKCEWEILSQMSGM